MQVEKKIAAELDAHGLLATPKNPHPRVPDYTDLSKLTYLSCVIKESMRMHTVGFNIEMCLKHMMEVSQVVENQQLVTDIQEPGSSLQSVLVCDVVYAKVWLGRFALCKNLR